MKLKILFFCSILLLCFLSPGISQTPVPEDYFDLYEMDDEDDEVDDENNNSSNEEFPKIKLEDLKDLIDGKDKLGAFGYYIESVVGNTDLSLKECSPTYICTTNILAKNMAIFRYEKRIRLAHSPYNSSSGLDCEGLKRLLQDYILYIGTINLEIYCVDDLYRDIDNFPDHEVIDAMYAMADLNEYLLSDEGDEDGWGYWIDDLANFRNARNEFDTQCINENRKSLPREERDCSCGDMDTNEPMDKVEKQKVLDHIRKIIDGINPRWQANKLLELNARLNELPCNK